MTSKETIKTQIRVYQKYSYIDFSKDLAQIKKDNPQIPSGVVNQAKRGYELTKGIQNVNAQIQPSNPLVQQAKKEIKQKKTTTKAKPVKKTTTKAKPVKKTTTKAKPVKKTTTKAKPLKKTTTKAKPVKKTTTKAKKRKPKPKLTVKKEYKPLKPRKIIESEDNVVKEPQKFNVRLAPYGHKQKKYSKKTLDKFRKDAYHIFRGKVQGLPPRPSIKQLKIKNVWEIKGSTSSSLHQVTLKIRLIIESDEYGTIGDDENEAFWLTFNSGVSNIIDIKHLYLIAWKKMEEKLGAKYKFYTIEIDLIVLRMLIPKKDE